MKNILNISLKTRCFPHVSFGGNLLGAFLPRQGLGITSQAWPGGAPAVRRSHPAHQTYPHKALGRPLTASLGTQQAPAPGCPCPGQGRMTVLWWHSHMRCPDHLASPHPITGAVPINHSSRPGLHVNFAPGVILILHIDFSQTFTRKHTHGNSHPSSCRHGTHGSNTTDRFCFYLIMTYDFCCNRIRGRRERNTLRQCKEI